MTQTTAHPGLMAAAVRLADVLATENAALAALNMTAAARLLPEKIAAADAFAAVQAEAFKASAGRSRAELETLARRLRDLTAENRRLLERAMRVQGRVIETVARAARITAERAAAPAYGRRPAPRLAACAVLTRA